MVSTDMVMTFASQIGLNADNVGILGPHLADRLCELMALEANERSQAVPANYLATMAVLSSQRMLLMNHWRTPSYDCRGNAEKDIRVLTTALYAAADWYNHFTGDKSTPLDIVLALKP